ncbi:unnamed protein product, partial [Cyprideis torosa]
CRKLLQRTEQAMAHIIFMSVTQDGCQLQQNSASVSVFTESHSKDLAFDIGATTIEDTANKYSTSEFRRSLPSLLAENFGAETASDTRTCDGHGGTRKESAVNGKRPSSGPSPGQAIPFAPPELENSYRKLQQSAAPLVTNAFDFFGKSTPPLLCNHLRESSAKVETLEGK